MPTPFRCCTIALVACDFVANFDASPVIHGLRAGELLSCYLTPFPLSFRRDPVSPVSIYRRNSLTRIRRLLPTRNAINSPRSIALRTVRTQTRSKRLAS